MDPRYYFCTREVDVDSVLGRRAVGPGRGGCRVLARGGLWGRLPGVLLTRPGALLWPRVLPALLVAAVQFGKAGEARSPPPFGIVFWRPSPW